MPLIDTECQNAACAAIQTYNRPLAEWPATRPCEACGGETAQVHLPPRVTWAVDPVIAYKAPDGTFRFPGATAGASVANYEKQGYTRIEMRSAADVRRFERQVEDQQRGESSRRVEAAHAQREARDKHHRSELFHRMKTMSTYGRDLARAAMANGNSRRQEASQDSGFYVEVFSQDRGSRDRSRDERGQRRRE